MSKTRALKTVLDGGLSYSLISRLINALSEDQKKNITFSGNLINLVDGRGIEQKVPVEYVSACAQITPKHIASKSTIYFKSRLSVMSGNIVYNPIERKRGRPKGAKNVSKC
jgi:hypothetical protein